ncbi:caspase family protein [Neorhizobium sp. R1-B]|uniref:caspase family protein n=1 Tax=Neorhizobium sp. R1-B TaxID=2485162 RepID=UPI001065D5E3|nr:caspase family protein [Neorhizobium sp. R1-B]
MAMTLRRRDILSAAALSPIFLIQGKATSLAQSSQTNTTRSKVALVIANSTYAEQSPLNGPSRDSKLVVDQLRKIGFTCSLKTDLDQSTTIREICEFRKGARLADMAILYYCGHAIELDGTNFIVPTDASMEDTFSASNTCIDILMAAQSVSFAKVLGILVVDACRDNPYLSDMTVDAGVRRQFSRGLAPYLPAQNVLIQYSAAPGQVAKDGDGTRGSPFARAFVSALSAKDEPIMRAMQAVVKDVLADTYNEQKPYFAGSIHDQNLSLNGSNPGAPSSGVIVDFQIADYEDVTVSDLVQYGFAYKAEGVDSEGNTTIRPDNDYFDALAEGRTPVCLAEDVGYFSPEEFSGWGISFPLLDLVARRAKNEVITISELVVEVKRSAPDNTTYVDFEAPSDEFCRVVVYNEGWSNIESAVFEYNVYVSDPTDVDDMDKFVQDANRNSYSFRLKTGEFRESWHLSVEEGVAQSLPDFAMHSYAFSNAPWSGAGRTGRKPAGYDQWLAAHPYVFEPDNEQRKSPWIVGRLTVTPKGQDSLPFVVNVVANISIYAPEGLGGGGVAYNDVTSVDLRVNGADYLVRKNIVYQLDNDTKTYRVLMPLVAEKTSDHVLRVSVIGNGGKQLFRSDWLNIKLVVPRMSKRYASFEKQ